jgi:hypothetical protein
VEQSVVRLVSNEEVRGSKPRRSTLLTPTFTIVSQPDVVGVSHTVYECQTNFAGFSNLIGDRCTLLACRCWIFGYLASYPGEV